MNSLTSSADPTVMVKAAECGKHGAYEAKEIPMPFEGMKPLRLGCPTCGAEYRENEERRKAAAEAMEQTNRIAALFRRSGIPARFSDRTFASYVARTDAQHRALRTASRFAESVIESPQLGASLVMCGSPGTGKTHLACAIGRELANNMRSVFFSTVLAAIRHVKETYRRDSERAESEAIRDLLEPDLLILDEIGVQVGSEHEKMILFEVINGRYQDCKSTVLISNLSQDELLAYLGDRIMDRFREAGGVIAFDWPSHRRRLAA